VATGKSSIARRASITKGSFGKDKSAFPKRTICQTLGGTEKKRMLREETHLKEGRWKGSLQKKIMKSLTFKNRENDYGKSKS